MEIKKYYLTKNKCYTNGTIIKPKGFMLHSTGANNPYLKRYVQPDDSILGYNSNGNSWNDSEIRVAVHGFIGKDKNGIVKAYQTLPYNFKAWHCGGSGNTTHVSWEICEDDLTDEIYFNEVYQSAVEIATQFCKEYGLTEDCITDHSDGYLEGIASNHGDIKHWFSMYSKTMDDFRADVKDSLKVGDKMSMDEFEKMFDSLMEKRKLETASEWAKEIQSEIIDSGISDGTRPRSFVERQESWAMNINTMKAIKKEIVKDVTDEIINRLNS